MIPVPTTGYLPPNRDDDFNNDDLLMKIEEENLTMSMMVWLLPFIPYFAHTLTNSIAVVCTTQQQHTLAQDKQQKMCHTWKPSMMLFQNSIEQDGK